MTVTVRIPAASVRVTAVVPEGTIRVTIPGSTGGSGGGAVSSVFGRSGDVTAQTGDYAVAQITGLQAALDAKAASSHSHAISDTTGLQTALDGKSATGHSHAISDTTGLQTALDGKEAAGAATSAVAAHVAAVDPHTQYALEDDVATALSGKSDTGHSHSNAVASGAAGFMSGADKAKLDAVAYGALAATPSADQSNWNPTNWAATVAALDLTPASSAFIGGLSATTDGHVVVLHNRSAFLICLIEEDSGSTAANRFARVKGSMYILPGESVTARYSSLDSRWHIASQSRPVWAISENFQTLLPFSTTTVQNFGRGAMAVSATISNTASTTGPTNDFEAASYWQVTNTTASGSSDARAATAHLFRRGDTAGYNGFFFTSRVRFTALGATGSVAVGLTSSTAAITAQPSTLANCVLLGANGGSTNLSIFSGNASAGTPVDLGANFPVPSATAAYEVAFFAPGGGATVEYMVRRLDTRFVVSGTLSANIPVATTAVGPRINVTVGGTATPSTAQTNYLYMTGL